jgi:hypothetical protein
MGQLPQAPALFEEDDDIGRGRRRRRRRKRKEPTYDRAFENLGVGLAFLFISIAVAFFVPSGKFWWFWLLIPAFACLGEGIGQLMRLRKGLLPAAASLPAAEVSAGARVTRDLPPPSAQDEIMAPPPSVTEGTTRHLGAERRQK